MLPAVAAAGGALFLCLPGVRMFAGILGKIMPKDETEAVGRGSFIGRTAVITLGTASHDNTAEARLNDKFGQSHYVRVEPDLSDQSFSQGEKVLLVRQDGARFFVIKAP